MFRAAFPSAPDEAERVESSWVKANYDTFGANGSASNPSIRLRLAGTWVQPQVAVAIAPAYSLAHVIGPLANAEPDPDQEYRRSTKQNSPQVTTTNGSVSGSRTRNEVVVPASPSPASGQSNPNKRRKESSPAPSNTSGVAQPDTLTVPQPRRSGRTASPAHHAQAPASAEATIRSTRSKNSKAPSSRASLKPTSRNGKLVSRMTPAESDHAQADDDDDDYDPPMPTYEQLEAEMEAKFGPQIHDLSIDMPTPDMEREIAEQKALVAKLKAEREEARVKASMLATTSTVAKPGRSARSPSSAPVQQTPPPVLGNAPVNDVKKSESTSADPPQTSQAVKRPIDEVEAPLRFEFREPNAESSIAARPIASNRRIVDRINLAPQQKSAAWGVLWFTAGLAVA